MHDYREPSFVNIAKIYNISSMNLIFYEPSFLRFIKVILAWGVLLSMVEETAQSNKDTLHQWNRVASVVSEENQVA